VAVDHVLVTPQQAEGREYRATFPGFDVRRQPGDRRFLQRVHGSKTPLPENNFVGNNYARYRNAEFDALIDRYFVTIPQDQRSQVLGQIVQQMTDQVVILTLFFQTSPIMVANRLNGLTGPAQGWNVHEWDVRA
jgi:ABC-type transport system substrate-binding protein